MMKKTIHIFILVLTGLFLLTTCKNPKIDYESFSITKENIKPEIHKVVISGEYDLIGEVSSMKLNIGQNEQLVDAESHLMNIDGQSFSVAVDSLSAGSLYYYCYVVEFTDGYKMLTEIGEFTTLSDKPLVKTLEITDGDATSFLVTCLVEDDFGLAITERGIYWNTDGNPGVNDLKVKHEETGVGEYVCKMENLEPNKIYYVRAYAKNEEGVGLGDILYHQMVVTELPTVITADVSDITSISATCGGTVISEGGSPVSSRGVCWSTEQNPTIENHITADGSGLGDFVSLLTDLTPNTLYYLRAYATNSYGTNYGDEVYFTAVDGLPEVITLEVTDIGDDTAIGHGMVTSEGASEVVERGICWGLNPNPDINDSHGNSGVGLGEYSVTITNIVPGRTYYVRSYAKNTQGIAYGNEESFMKLIEKPSVTLDSVSNITSSGATVYGTLINDGGGEVTEMGICWGTNINPTIGGDHASVDVVTGVFSKSINGLASGTVYHVRAYAVNSAGTAYSDDYSFTTTLSLVTPPTVTTYAEVSDITQTSAICGGTVTNSGGETVSVTERGLCWSTHPNPTVNDYTMPIGSGMGDFSGMINGLTMGTVYYLKAYATNSGNKTGYGEERVFTTLSRPEGSLGHLFSVGANKQVWFSSGNLQYLATSNIWRFAENQWDYAGNNNGSMLPDYNNWIDLFGWGTSNYNHGANKWEPWSTSSTNSDYYAYGQAAYNLYNQTGQADWGYNAISNGGNQEHLGWRTLNYLEWDYLLTQRQTTSGARFAKAVVHDINGLVIFPDDWNASVHSFNYVNSLVSSFAVNTLTNDVWNVVEEAGAVFLPAAGSRYGRQISNLNSIGYYWSASNKAGGVTAYYLYFTGSEIDPMHDSGRCYGRIVRLVFDKQ